MKKIILVVVLLITFSCKNEKKEVKEPKIINKEIVEPVKVQEIVISESKIPPYSNWINNGIIISETSENFNGEGVILMSRENGTNSSYTGLNNLMVEYGSTYKVSIIVKKGGVGKDFALRIQGVYPNRVDAIFDLETGKVKEPKISGDDELAEKAKATIESLGNGWYKCSLYSDIFAKYVRVVLGPTKGNLNTTLWETRTGEKSSTYIVPLSLKLEEY